MVRTKFYNSGRLWEITAEPSQLELSFLHATLLPNALYNLTKFHENSSKGIGVMGRTRFRLQTDGQTGAGAIAISPEPIGRGIKMYGAHPNAHRSKLDLAVKGQMSVYDHHFSNFVRPPVPDDLCKVSATRHPRLWRSRFLKVFPIYGN